MCRDFAILPRLAAVFEIQMLCLPQPPKERALRIHATVDGNI